jgi:hypothetical protein
MKKWRKGPSTKEVDEVAKIIGLNESFINEGDIKAKTQVVIDKIKTNPHPLITAINRELKEASNIASSNDLIDSIWDKITKQSGNIQTNEAFALIANYSGSKTISNMTRDSSKLAESVRRLVAEMLFGGTKLPLWKVYGDFGKGDSYEYLGTIETFVKDLPEVKIPVFGWRASPSETKNNYVFKVLMLEGVEEEGKKYVELRVGTNSSSKITFNIEGTRIVGPLELDKPLSELLRRK